MQGNLQIHQVHVGQDGQVNVSTLYHHSLSMWVFLLPFSLSSCFSSFDLRLWCLGQRALPVSHLCSVRSERNFRSKAAHPNTFSNSSFCIHVYVTPWLTTWFCMACVLRRESDRCLWSVCLALLSLALNHTFYFNSDPATKREILRTTFWEACCKHFTIALNYFLCGARLRCVYCGVQNLSLLLKMLLFARHDLHMKVSLTITWVLTFYLAINDMASAVCMDFVWLVPLSSF